MNMCSIERHFYLESRVSAAENVATIKDRAIDALTVRLAAAERLLRDYPGIVARAAAHSRRADDVELRAWEERVAAYEKAYFGEVDRSGQVGVEVINPPVETPPMPAPTPQTHPYIDRIRGIAKPTDLNSEKPR